MVLVVTDVLVHFSSVVTECCEDVSREFHWELVEPLSSCCSKKRSS